MLGKLAIYGAGAALVAGGGTAFALDFRKKLAEGDLDRIGNGTPAVVQIHDPQCGMCATLQKAARKAFAACNEDQPAQYLVANIRSEAGADFAASMGLPHVTLVFFTATGRHVHTIEGITPADQIKAEITRHFG
ncbi:hypothetical protein ACS3SW_04345 [Roseobacteraceae bacterium S113]